VPHHVAFDMFALDTKVDLPETGTRADLMKDGRPHPRARFPGRFFQSLDRNKTDLESYSLSFFGCEEAT